MIATGGKSIVNGVAPFEQRPIVHLRLLGVYELAVGGVVIRPPQTAKARSLVAYLALRRDEFVRREALLSEFWPDADPTSARNNLKTTLSTIRRTFRDAGLNPDAVLEVSRDTVRWIAGVVVDMRDFERCSIQVDDERRWAISLYRGEFSPGDSSEWAQYTRERLAFRFEETLRKELASAPTAELAERLIALDPFSDEAYIALIDGALQNGDVRAARAIYRRYEAALVEVGQVPPSDLAARLQLRARASVDSGPFAFCGRADEFAEIERILKTDTQVIFISGVPGIGKTAFAREVAARFADREIVVVDATAEDVQPHFANGGVALFCATPENAARLRAAFPHAEEIMLESLAYDEVAVAMRRQFAWTNAELVQAAWKRSGGYPLVLAGLVSAIEDAGDTLSRSTLERLRLPRDLERYFDVQLRGAGSDVVEIAVFLALESELNSDDLAALLDWNLERVRTARERLLEFDAAYRFCLEAALRTLSPSRRRTALERIAERLRLHADANAKLRLAGLFAEIGHARDAGAAYLDAAKAFAASASWETAVLSADAGIDTLETIATPGVPVEDLRQLHILKGHALYHQGAYVPSIQSLEAAMQISDERADSEMRTGALVSIGNALIRADMLEPAWAVAQQALQESSRAGKPRSIIGAEHLVARVLRDRFEYADAVSVAQRAYNRSMEAREWSMAVMSANVIIEVSRRLLQFNVCFLWAQRQLEAALLAGPLFEAESRHMLGSVKTVVQRLDDAVQEFRHALTLTEHLRRRNVSSTTPTEQVEWMLHHALAHTHISAERFDEAIVEAEWIVRSPWTFNSPFCSWQALSVSVDARLATGSDRDVTAARLLLERVPVAASEDPRACLDVLARARVAARLRAAEAPELLRKAYESLITVSKVHADQVHPYFFRLAESARGIDDILAARAAACAHELEQRIIESAGAYWGRSA